MKRINTKLLAITAASVVFFTIGVVGLHYFQTSRHAEAKLRSGDRSRQAGDLERAKRMYGSYLARNPDDAERWTVFATISVEWLNKLVEDRRGAIGGQEFMPVYNAVAEALRQNPDDIEFLKVAAKFSFDYGSRAQTWPEAVQRYGKLVEVLGSEAPLEYRRNLLLALQMAGEPARQMEYLGKWLAFDPVRQQFLSETQPPEAFCDAYAILANSLRNAQGAAELADQVVHRMVEQNSGNYEAYLNRYEYYKNAQVDRGDEGYGDLEKAFELAPDEPAVVLTLAQSLLQRGELDRVKELMDAYLVKHPDDANAYMFLARWAVMRQQPDQAISYIDKGLSLSPGHGHLLWTKATVLLEQKDFAGLQRVKADLKKARLREQLIAVYTGVLDGWERMHKGEWWEAQESLEQVRLTLVSSSLPDTVDMLRLVETNLAECYERLGQHDRRLEAFNRILQMDSSNEVARWGRIDCLLALDQDPQAISEYRALQAAVDKIEDIPTAFLLKHLQLEVLLQEQRPEAQRSWSRAQDLVRRVNSLENVTDSAKLSVIIAYLRATGNVSRAEELEQRLRNLEPSNIEVALSEVRTLARTDAQAALKRLEELSTDFGNSFSIQLMRFGLVAQIGGDQLQEKLAAIEAGAESLPPNQRAVLFERMGRHRVALREFSEAKRLWNKCLESSDKKPLIYEYLFELAVSVGDIQGMEEARAGVAKITGADSPEVQWMDAARISYLVANEQLPLSELEKARALVHSAQASRSNWDSLYRLEGQIALQMGDTNTARVALENALKSGPSNPTVLRRVAEIYYSNRQYDDAERMIRSIDESQWTSKDRRIVYESLARRGKLPQDVVLDESTTDPNDLIWYSQLFYNAGRMEDSLKAAQKATEVAPALPPAWQNLVHLLVANQKVDEARDAIRKAQLEVSEQDAPRLLGGCYEMIGEFGEAERYYRLYLESNPDDPIAIRNLASMYAYIGRFPESLKYLDQLLKSPDGSIHRNPTTNWARRTKARILASTKSFSDFNEALRLIEENVAPESVMGPDDLIAWGQLSVERTDEFSRARAVQYIESVQNARNLTDPEQLILAELYEKQGRWSDCKAIMQGLLTQHPNDLSLLTPWLRWLLQHDDLRDAERWLQNCPENSVVALLTRTELLVRRGRTDDAKQLLARIIPKGELTPESLRIVLQIARLTESLGQYDASLYPISEKLLREYLKLRPHEQLELALFLGRRGGASQIDEAISLCETFFNQGHRRAALAAANSVIYGNRSKLPPDSPIVNKVRGWFEAAQKEEPDSPGLMVQRSDFENAVQNFGEVETWLRRYLKVESADSRGLAGARNNLAYLLALRGDGQESLELIESAIAELGPRAELRDTRATVRIARKEYDKALEDIEAAMNEAGETAFRMFRQAYALGMMNNKAAAQESLKKAVELGLSPDLLNKLEVRQYQDLLKRLGISSEQLSAKSS